jgi:hypothetical protein
MSPMLVAFWNALEREDKSAMHIYKELAPLYFFEHQLPGCYKEALFRRA